MARKKNTATEEEDKGDPTGSLLPKGIVCQDCGDPVDLIVTRDQVVGANVFVCIDCKVDRMKQRTDEKIEQLKVEAREARARLSQPSLPL